MPGLKAITTRMVFFLAAGTCFALLAGCEPSIPVAEGSLVFRRETSIPSGAQKILPSGDPAPPRVLVPGFEQPVPVPGAVNTAGGEDSPFITPDGTSLYFFFTPDVSVPVEKQLQDGVTGIYVSRLEGGLWSPGERILLQDNGKLALDGCEFVQGERMWFCTAREGYQGVQWFTAEFTDGAWQGWRSAEFDPALEIGELHISPDGSQLYFASNRPGGKGGLDIWMSGLENGAWQEPANLSVINTQEDEGWPTLSPDGHELWFYRLYSVWRSVRTEGVWGQAEQVVSPLAGEPGLDADGNLYFVHHFYLDGKMVESDIYYARRQ